MVHQHEAFSRVLIDKELENGKWDLLDNYQVCFESHTCEGHADHFPMDKNGGV
jgi:hypothetical protein